MTKQITIILLIALTFVGCNNFFDNINDRVNNDIKNSETEMITDVEILVGTFREKYKKVKKRSIDSLVIKRVTNLYCSVNETLKYIDSLKSEMNKLDNKDLKNTDLIKNKFLNEGIGDSVFNRVKQSYTYTIDVALTDTSKSRLRKERDTYTEETKRQFFELTEPLGVRMILYGIELELIKDATQSLYGY